MSANETSGVGTGTEIDPRQFRNVLGQFCTGVTIITTVDDDAPVGFACQSFAALSLDPPLVLFCPTGDQKDDMDGLVVQGFPLDSCSTHANTDRDILHLVDLYMGNGDPQTDPGAQNLLARKNRPPEHILIQNVGRGGKTIDQPVQGHLFVYSLQENDP